MEMNYRRFPKGEGYFESLPKLQQNMIQRMLQDAFATANTPDMYHCETNTLECRSRDGFIPHSHNKGGISVVGYSDQYAIWGSGCYPKNKKSHKIIENIIEYNLRTTAGYFFQENKKELNKLGFNNSTEISYHELYKANEGSLAERLSEYESESLSGDYSSVQYEIQAMYHGVQKSVHSMTVFASISASDAPYHRRCDVLNEVTISWKTGTVLKLKLFQALKKLVKDTF